MFNVLVAVFVIANTKTSIYQYMYFLYPCLKNREKKQIPCGIFVEFFVLQVFIPDIF